MKTLQIRFVFITILLIFFTGCNKKWELAPDEFIFIEAFNYSHITVIDNPRGRTLGSNCCPTYTFDAKNGMLKGKMNFPLNDELLLIFGTGMKDESEFGINISSSLIGVDFYPVHIQPELRLEEIKDEGVVELKYLGENFLIYPDDEIHLSPSIDTIYTWGEMILEVYNAYKVIHHGILNKSGLIPE